MQEYNRNRYILSIESNITRLTTTNEYQIRTMYWTMHRCLHPYTIQHRRSDGESKRVGPIGDILPLGKVESVHLYIHYNLKMHKLGSNYGSRK